MPIHLVMVAADTADNQAQLENARGVLTAAGFNVEIAIRAGEVEPTLHAYQAEHGIDLLVMRAYCHSRIRPFFVGRTTPNILRPPPTPLGNASCWERVCQHVQRPRGPAKF